MKILSALFQNYIGLVEGLGREVVTLDFSEFNESEIRKIMLVGRNGVGKSVISNALSPFAENFDNRDFVIIPGRIGRKEIVYETRDGTIVKCVHMWTKTGKVKSFVYLNDDVDPVSETAKGNVTNFKAVVKEYLGVDPDFMKIGKVGSDINNFIDLKPTERKTYLSKFMPEMEEWARMNKNAGNRLTNIKREMRGLEVELDKLDNLDIILATMEKLKITISGLQTEKEKLDYARGEETNKLENSVSQIDGVLENIIAELTPLVGNVDFSSVINGSTNSIRSLRIHYETLAAEAQAGVDSVIAKLSNLQAYVDGTASDTLLERIAAFKDKLAVAETGVTFLSQKRLDVMREQEQTSLAITETDNELSKISKTEETVARLNRELTTAEKAHTDLLKKYESVSYDDLDDTISFEEVKTTSDHIRHLCSSVDTVLTHFNSSEILEECVNCEFDTKSVSELAKSFRSKSSDQRDLITSRQTRKKLAESQVAYAKHMRVHTCRDPNCPHEKFIDELLQSSKQIETFDEEQVRLAEKVKHYDELAESYSNAMVGCTQVVQMFNQMTTHRTLLKKVGAWDYFTSFTNFTELLQLSQQDITEILSVDHYLESLSAKREITNSETLIANIKAKIESQQTNSEYLEFFKNKRVQQCEARTAADMALTEVDAKLSAENANIAKYRAVVTMCEALYEHLSMLSKANQAIGIIASWVAKNSKMLELSDTIQNKLDTIKQSHKTVSDSLATSEQEYNRLSLKHSRRLEFETRLKELENTLNKTNVIYNATHPTKGAPVNFIKSFLESVRNIVNDLLDTALDGDMRIDFELNDKEFKIPVIKASGAVIPDVLQCSLGQVSLVKTVLSLALVKNLYVNSNTAYNIISLDEIDGALDFEKNRKRFTNIVEKLCHELGIEQVFIISHNDNFYASELGLILFPGHCMPITDETFMSNKLIVTNLDE